jgi:hypothetical protein
MQNPMTKHGEVHPGQVTDVQNHTSVAAFERQHKLQGRPGQRRSQGKMKNVQKQPVLDRSKANDMNMAVLKRIDPNLEEVCARRPRDGSCCCCPKKERPPYRL